MVIDTECICSCKSNYHTIVATTFPHDVDDVIKTICEKNKIQNIFFLAHLDGTRFSPVGRNGKYFKYLYGLEFMVF